MSERWKFQIKHGLIWGILMIILLSIFDVSGLPWSEDFSWRVLLIRIIAFPVTGVFLYGYFIWKTKKVPK